MKERHKIISIFLSLCLLLGTVPQMAFAANGDPTLAEDGYYEISTAEELCWFAEQVNGGNTAISGKLVADITITDNTIIGSEANKYIGDFNGNSHTVTVNYNITSDGVINDIGLFGYLGVGANIHDLNTTGTIDGNNVAFFVGGIAGHSDGGIVRRCISDVVIENVTDCAGGIGGYFVKSKVENCAFLGAIKNSVKIGAILGFSGWKNVGTDTVNCFTTATFEGAENAQESGSVSRGAGNIVNCYYFNPLNDKTGTQKTAEEFASGEVAYLLNASTSEGAPIWRQNLPGKEPVDMLPVLDPTHDGVAFENDTYYNFCIHNFDNGFCTSCGDYQPATLNGDTYEIGNAGQLYWFAALVNGDTPHADFDAQNLAANAVLTADIVVNQNVLNADGELNGDGSTFRQWTPIGNWDNKYSGVFDGQSHTISGLYFNDDTQDDIGLFGCADTNAQIKNVGVIDSYIKGYNYVGGVCGYNKGNITNCYSTGSVSGNWYIGGVCGKIFNGTIENCYNTGAVSGNWCGGVCGENENGTITNCYYLNTAYNGGIDGADVAGSAEAKTAEQFKSGEVAYLLGGDQTNIAFKQTIGTDATPNFTGKQVYKVDKFDCPKDTVAETAYSNTNAVIKADEHPFDSNGFCTVCDQYQPAVLNDDGVYEIGNAGQLYWFAALVNGDTTHADFDAQNKAANAVLTADIVVNQNVLNADGTLNGDGSNFRVWMPIGNLENTYAGIFDGQSHTVSGLYFNNDGQSYVGLFSYADTGSEIKNVGVICGYIKGKLSVGGVCGSNYGTITNCYNAGTVNGNEFGIGVDFGGVCGINKGIITNCYNTGTVSAGNWVGGVCGDNGGTITNCYNRGVVDGEPGSGGVCGVNTGTIMNCYDIGVVRKTGWNGGICGGNSGTITNCYYLDTACNGGINGADVAGSAEAKTTEEFKSGEVAFFLNAGQPTPVFKQKIGTDAAPNFTSESTVYQITFVDYAGTNANAFVYGNAGDTITVLSPYDSGYTFKNASGEFEELSTFGAANVSYTAVPAATYIVVIPETVALNEDNVNADGDYEMTGFSISAQTKWLAGNGQSLTVTAESSNGFILKDPETTNGIPYVYTANTTAVTNGGTVLAISGESDDENATAAGTLIVRKGDVVYAGEYKDTLVFTIGLTPAS